MAQANPTPVVLIGIAGGSGAGKTYVTDRVLKMLGRGAVPVSLDDFYRDRSHLSPKRRARVNFDHPRAIDWDAAVSVLERLRQGKPTRVPSYDFATHCRTPNGRRLGQSRFVLVEGLWALRHPRLRRLFDLKVYLDCPTDLRLKRRLARDAADRGRTEAEIRAQFRQTVEPMHARYVAPQARWADVILPVDRTAADLAQLAASIRELRRSLFQ